MNKMLVEIDGNDGVGKTFIISKLKEHINYCDFKDRGILSKMTLLDINNIDLSLLDHNVIYILIDDTVEHCQERIKLRGDSLDEQFHTVSDLTLYKKKFIDLYNLIKQDKRFSNNILLVNRDKSEFDITIIINFIKERYEQNYRRNK